MSYLIKLKENLYKHKYGKYLLFGSLTFFFIKGLVWLVIFIAVGLGFTNYF